MKFGRILASWAFVIVFILCLLNGSALLAMQAPRPGEIQRYLKDGTFTAREEFVRKTDNHRVSPDLVARKIEKIRDNDDTFRVKAFPYPTGLPSKGSPRVFVLLIDFPNYPNTNAESVFTSKLFGTGNAAEKPYESLREYYRRSSYYYSKDAGDALDIQGDVLPWYRAKNNRSSYLNAESLIKEALEHHTSSHDFSVYDNNGDGVIDFFMVFYTGPDTGWGSLWWAWCDRFYDDSFTVDGKKLFKYCFQWECNPVGQEFKPRVVIHETGHGLGLPDYYDYKDTIGPRGGVGELDMMDANWGDHNAFSKWLLDWITPTVIGSSDVIHSIRLRPSSLFPDAVVIMPGQTLSNPFSEYFVVQNRSRREQGIESGEQTSNDFDYPNDGIVIWHVDARLNGAQDGFAFNNSDTIHKLLRLMEADGRESIEKGYRADAGDYYTPDKYLSGFSIPNSRDYGSQRTGVNVFNIYKIESIGFPRPPKFTFNVDFLISDAQITNIGDAVDNNSLTWISSGSQLGLGWFGQRTTYLVNQGAAQSTCPGNSGHSTMGTRLSGPSSLRFFWKVSSEANADYLELHLDGTLQDRISGEVDWIQKNLAIPEGEHFVTWKYIKNASNSSGADCGWVDKVECGVVPLGDALDNPGLEFIATENTEWYGQTFNYYYGGSAAQSGSIGHNQSAEMHVEVSGGSTISFEWKVSSEQNGDLLEFWIDSTKMATISGEMGWHRQTFTVPLYPLRRHSASWRYVKNARGTSGADCGWVDKVVIGNPTLGEGVDNVNLPWSTGGNVSWKYTNSVYYNASDGHDSVESVLPGGQTSYLETAVVGPGVLTFWWKATNVSCDLTLYMDGNYKAWCLDKNWVQRSIDIPPGGHVLRWEFESFGTSTDTAYLDMVIFAPEWLTLNEALDYMGFPMETYGSNPNASWTPRMDLGAWGMDSAQSGLIGNNQNSFLETTVHGPGLLTYNWKVSSEMNHDHLEFWLGSRSMGSISGEVGWQTKGFVIPAGTHDLTWLYWKDASGVAGADCGWVDKVDIQPLLPLSIALDNSELEWSTYASSEGGVWVGQSFDFYHGQSSARSGLLANKQNSQLITTLTGPGTLKFYWKVECHDYWNYLSVSLGAFDPAPDAFKKIVWKEKDKITNRVNWQECTVEIPEGVHHVMWKYVKSGSFSDDGSDCGWVDKVVYEKATGTGEAWEYYR